MTMIVYGHRGASKERPENTMEAFRFALELGADAIETDVHVTRDGAVVVHHDPDGARTAGDPRRIDAMTLKEVRAWDVATMDRARGGRVVADAPHRVPTFDELLEEVDVRINVDVKSEAPSAVERVLEVVQRHDAAGRVLLTSFHDAVVRDIWRRGYRGETGLARNGVLLALAPGLPRPFWPRGARVQIPVAMGPLSLASRRTILRLHARGLAVDYWVVDDPALACRLRDDGADGVMSDDVREVVRGLAAS
jgi:glycerophosphoryl diester phosphodiesterase